VGCEGAVRGNTIQDEQFQNESSALENFEYYNSVKKYQTKNQDQNTAPTMVLPLWYAVIPAVFICALAVAGGVGGGALYMPIYVWVMEDAHLAVPLAKVTTNGVAVAAACFNFSKSHPDDPRKPIINYDVALLLEPLTLIGTVIGVLLNVGMTSGQVLVTLVTVLSVTAYKTYVKGFQQRNKELAIASGELGGEK
jgi:uncharacterized membrane protein YfcA